MSCSRRCDGGHTFARDFTKEMTLHIHSIDDLIFFSARLYTVSLASLTGDAHRVPFADGNCTVAPSSPFSQIQVGDKIQNQDH